jgi:hypothetical protein
MRDASGQMYMRNRYYDPQTGQFTQPDPIGLDRIDEMEDEPSDEALYLVGVRLHPDTDGPQLCTVLLMNEDARGGKDRPLTDADGYILLFADPARASHAIALGDAAFRKHAVPAEIAAACDLAAAVWAVAEGSDSGETGDAVNLLLDLVEATGFPIPGEYRRDLFAITDHLAFSTDIHGFFAAGEYSRTELMHAITWCIGAVTIKSRLV